MKDKKYSQEKKLDSLDDQRRYALSHRDSTKYTQLCDYLGLEPEDQYLYEVGRLELDVNR